MVVISDRVLKSIPPLGACDSSIQEDVQMIRKVPGGATLAASRSWGRRSSVNRNGARQFIPRCCSMPCIVTAPTGTPPTPALFQSTSSLDSLAAKESGG